MFSDEDVRAVYDGCGVGWGGPPADPGRLYPRRPRNDQRQRSLPRRPHLASRHRLGFRHRRKFLQRLLSAVSLN